MYKMEGTQTTQMPIIQQPEGGNSQSNLCQAALQDAMEKCNMQQQQMMQSEPQQPMMEPQQQPMMEPQQPMMQTEQPQMMPEQVMDTPMPPVIEGFQSEMVLPKPSPSMVNNLMNALLMMCLFYLLSHKETVSFVMKTLKGIRGENVHVLMTLVFGVGYLFLKRYL